MCWISGVVTKLSKLSFWVKIVVILSLAQLVTTVFFSQLEISHVLNGTTPEIQHRKWGPRWKVTFAMLWSAKSSSGISQWPNLPVLNKTISIYCLGVGLRSGQVLELPFEILSFLHMQFMKKNHWPYAVSFYRTKMILDRPNCFGRVQMVLVGSKSFWSHSN